MDSLVSGLNGFKYIAVSDNGNIYLSDMINGISVYDGASLLEINDNFITGLDEPAGIAIGGDYLYVANFGGTTIGKYNATTGATINANFISGLTGPNAIVISDDGNYLYVVNSRATTVGMYNTSDGSAVNNNLVVGLNYPGGISISGSSLYIYSYFYEENSNDGNWCIAIYDVNIAEQVPGDALGEGEGGVGDTPDTGKIAHAAEYKLLWSGTDKTTGVAVTGSHTFTVNSTGESYEDAHYSSSETSHAFYRDYLRKNVTPFYRTVHYIIENTSTN